MTFGEYWKKIRNKYDYLTITDNDGNTFKLDEENSEILSESKVDLKKIEKYNEFWSKENNPDGLTKKGWEEHRQIYFSNHGIDLPEWVELGSAGHVEFYYEESGWKLTFYFPYEQEIELGKGYIMAETIDFPGEKIKLQFFKNNTVNCT